MENRLLVNLRDGKKLSLPQQILLIIQLSIPAILAQVSSTVMSYIDASMVGRLGASASASIGLVSSTTWVFGGIISAITTGFTVQIARQIGAKNEKSARLIVKEALTIGLFSSILLTLLGIGASQFMPGWLGGNADIIPDASKYLLVYACSILFVQINYLASGMLQCAGNMKTPSYLHVAMCLLDVIFNMLLIFPTASYHLGTFTITLPGANLSVLGAALGTAFSQVVIGSIMLGIVLFQSPALRLRHGEKFYFDPIHLRAAVRVGLPVGIEQMIMGSSYIITTKIVAPLGTISIAANSFAITAEGLCYMPGFGIGVAATTLIGQSIGAKRENLTRKLGWLTTIMGMSIMAIMGALMYILAPYMMATLSSNQEIIQLGTRILRIEAFAEPFYGASIVAAYVMRSAGDSFTSSALNLCSIWLIRLPLSYFLAKAMGLKGVWIAMCSELIVRGILFLIRLTSKKWIKSIYN